MDVPPGVDFLDEDQARSWALACEQDKPWRAPMRSLFVDLTRLLPKGAHVLELGAGPGLLAEEVLRGCPDLATYTLLDFSETMLTLSRARLEGSSMARFVRADFKSPGWRSDLRSDYAAVLAMQAVHEIRHKRHVPGFYQDITSLLHPGGRILVCDRTPSDSSLVATSLYLTVEEQIAALRHAGFAEAKVEMSIGHHVFVTATLAAE